MIELSKTIILLCIGALIGLCIAGYLKIKGQF